MKELLLVVADPFERHVLGASLASCGFNVTSSGDEVGAAAKANALAPDVIVADAALPALGGMAWIARHKRESGSPDVVVVALLSQDSLGGSEDSGDDEERRVLEAGADDCVARPVFARELAARIALALALRAQEGLPDARPGLSVGGRFAGSTAEVSAVDVLRSFERAGASGSLRIRQGQEEALFSFRRGRVLHAALGPVRGAEALARALTFSEASYEGELVPAAHDDEGGSALSGILARALGLEDAAEIDVLRLAPAPTPLRSDAPWAVATSGSEETDNSLSVERRDKGVSARLRAWVRPVLLTALAGAAAFVVALSVTSSVRSQRALAARRDDVGEPAPGAGIERPVQSSGRTTSDTRTARSFGGGDSRGGSSEPSLAGTPSGPADSPAPPETLARESALDTVVLPSRQTPKVREAERALLKGDVAGAIALAREATVSAPNDADAWLTLAAADKAAGDAVASREAYRNCVAAAKTEGVIHCRILAQASGP